MIQYRDYNWTDEEFTNAHSYLRDAISDFLPGDSSAILDVGCGNGALANYFIARGYNVYGIDASSSGIEIANRINPGRFFIQNIEEMRLPDQLKDIHFKTILSTEVIEHMYDPRGYIKFCRMALGKSSDGNLIISTPYHGYLKNLSISIMNGWDAHFTALWDGGHIKFWSSRTIKTLLNEANFEIDAFRGCGRIPLLWKSMIINAKLR
jgi:2-polyprenyl-3-methyl-5-hydroxy-6-metoxy-1,4-benzoquinol methylase